MKNLFLSDKTIEKRIKSLQNKRLRLKKEFNRLDKEILYEISDVMDRCQHSKVSEYFEYDDHGYCCEICGRHSSFPIKPDEKRAKEVVNKNKTKKI